MYENSKSLCSNIITLQKQTNKLIEKEIRFVLPEAWGGVRGNWMKVVKSYRLPVIR